MPTSLTVFMYALLLSLSSRNRRRLLFRRGNSRSSKRGGSLDFQALANTSGVWVRTCRGMLSRYRCLGFEAHVEHAVCLHSEQTLMAMSDKRCSRSQAHSRELSFASFANFAILISLGSVGRDMCFLIAFA